nr:response regulator [uncultured Desulfobacter sp.]
MLDLMEINTLENDTGEVIRMLLVDDEDSYRNAIARRLERRNMVVSQTPDDTSCLEYLGGNEADVVVLNMKMPVMSGMDTFKAIYQQIPSGPAGDFSDHEELEPGQGATFTICLPEWQSD